MIHPDRGKLELSLGDDKPTLELWFSNAALVAICDRAGFEVPLSESMRLVDEHLIPRNLAIYIWAGCLRRNLEIPFEEIQDRVRWTTRPTLEILKDVRRALILGLVGKDPEKEREEADPPKPAVNGAGGPPSVSPSASSDSP